MKIAEKSRSIYFTVVCLLIAGISSVMLNAKGRSVAEMNRAKSRHYYLEAAQRAANGDYAESYELNRKAVGSDPENAEATLEYALQRSALSPMSGHTDSIALARLLDKVVVLTERYPSDFFTIYDYVALRQHLGDIPEGIRVMEKFLEHNPGHTDALQMMTDLYLDNGEFEKSLATLEEYERIEGKDVKLTIRKAGIHIAQGDTIGAIGEASKLIESDRNNPQYWVLKGQLEQYINQPDSAIASYSEAERISPEGSGAAKIQLSEIYKQRGDSATYYKKVYEALMAEDLPFEVKNDLLAYYLQNQLKAGGDNSRGDRLFETLLRQYPHEAGLQWLSARYKAAKKDYPGALEEISYAIDLDPVKEDYRLEAMHFAYFAKQYDDIDRIFNDAERQLSPLQPGTIIAYAQLLSAQEKYVQSLERYTELLKRDFPELSLDMPLDVNRLAKNTTVEQLEELVEIYQGAGDNYNMLDSTPDRTFLCYDNALQLNDSPLILNNYAYFIVKNPGRDVTPEELNKALMMSEKAVKEDPGNPTYMDTRAWVLFRAGDISGARDMIEAAIETAESRGEALDKEYYDHLGDILMESGEPGKARDAWEKALELDPDNKDIKKKLK